MATICWHEHVERVARVVGLLDQARLHALDDDRGLERGRPGASGRACRGSARPPGGRRGRCAAGPVATAPGDSTWMTRSTAPMSMPSSRLRRGDETLEPTGLELVLDLQPPLARQRAVVGLDQLLLHRRGALGLRGAVLALPVQLVEPGGQALGQAAGVDEDERRAVLLDQLEQPRVHRRPDASGGPGRPRPGPTWARR